MSLFKLGIGLAASVAIGLMLWTIYDWIDDSLKAHYVTPVKQEMQAKIDAEKTRADTAEKINKILRSDVDRVKGDVVACNARVDSLVKDQMIGIEMGIRARQEILNRWAKDQDEMRRREALAMGPPTEGGFCDQAKKADDVLSDLADRQRMRHPGGTGTPGQ